jgi:hypothetical protein
MLPAANTNSGNYFYVDETTHLLGSVEQSPLSRTLFTVDYSGWLDSGETISSAVVNASSGDLIASAAYILPSSTNTAVSFTLTGGIADITYEADLIVTTSIGEVKLSRLYVSVVDAGALVGEAYASAF